jgi:hypothetical protein
LRPVILILATCLLGACAQDVTMWNPRTNETRICSGSPGGIDPYSQNYACAAGLAAQGWRQINQPAGYLLFPGM